MWFSKSSAGHTQKLKYWLHPTERPRDQKEERSDKLSQPISPSPPQFHSLWLDGPLPTLFLVGGTYHQSTSIVFLWKATFSPLCEAIVSKSHLKSYEVLFTTSFIPILFLILVIDLDKNAVSIFTESICYPMMMSMDTMLLKSYYTCLACLHTIVPLS